MVEEFVYLGSLVHSSTRSSPDTSRRIVITRAAMQNLDKQIWRSRITIPIKLKLYNTCILPVFLYGSECWAVTKRDVLKIDALDQWCLRKLLGIKWYHHVRNDEVRRTTCRLLSKHGDFLCSAILQECQARQMPGVSYLLPLRRTGGNHQDVLKLRG